MGPLFYGLAFVRIAIQRHLKEVLLRLPVLKRNSIPNGSNVQWLALASVRRRIIRQNTCTQLAISLETRLLFASYSIVSFLQRRIQFLIEREDRDK